jgi:hypothetical protein
MKRKITKIEPFQLGKILAALYAAMSLLFVPFMVLFSLIANFAPQPEGQEIPTGFFFGFGLVFSLLAPLFYGFMGFLTGVVGAFIYNLVAKKFGGIEVEVE